MAASSHSSQRSLLRRARRGAPPAAEAGQSPASSAARLERLSRLARLMDKAIRIPGTNIGVGLDSLIGLVPGLGDAATAIVSGHIIREAAKLGVPRRTLARMTANALIDLGLGAVPIVGDLFDVAWKANVKNVALIEKSLRSRS